MMEMLIKEDNMSSSQRFKLGSPDHCQTLLPLSHWDSGIGVEDIWHIYP